jgi:hypothetical protein
LCPNLPVATVIAFEHFVIEEFWFIMEAHLIAVDFGCVYQGEKYSLLVYQP